MKNLYLILVCGTIFNKSFSKDIFHKLCEVNKEWKLQKEIPTYTNNDLQLNEKEWIQFHLQFVETLLRKKNVSHLSTLEKEQRIKHLNNLHTYWVKGDFPINIDYTSRTPIFIDKYNNLCAVGYLMKSSGYENIARKIQATNNLIYVRDIQNKDALEWISNSGLSVEECALIQPSYLSSSIFSPLKKGVNGLVYSLLTDSSGSKLYVGGDFTKVDSIISSPGIAVWRNIGSGYEWQDLGNGINNFTVRAIQEFEGNIWVAGNFQTTPTYGSCVKYWNGTVWNNVGQINGLINDIQLFQGQLYIGGDFINLANGASYHLAKWNSTLGSWNGIETTTSGIVGIANVMTVFQNKLIVGGSISNASNSNFMNIYAYSGLSFNELGDGCASPIHTLELHNNYLYAAGDLVGPSKKIKFFNGTAWNNYVTVAVSSSQINPNIRSLKSVANHLCWGGNFKHDAISFMDAKNFVSDFPNYYYGNFDSTIYAIEEFEGKVIVGGAFSQNFKHIAFMSNTPNSLIEIANNKKNIDIYPNPITDNINIISSIPFLNATVSIQNMKGQIVFQKKLTGVNFSFDISNLQSGIYLADIYENGNHLRSKFVKQ